MLSARVHDSTKQASRYRSSMLSVKYNPCSVSRRLQYVPNLKLKDDCYYFSGKFRSLGGKTDYGIQPTVVLTVEFILTNRNARDGRIKQSAANFGHTIT
jgi:hypothetical protein